MPDFWGCTEVDDDNMLIATYADETAVMVRSPSIDIATLGLQEYVTRFQMAFPTEPVTQEEVVTKIGKLKNKKLHSRTCWTTKR